MHNKITANEATRLIYFFYKISMKKNLFKQFRLRYNKEQMKLLNMLQKSRRKMQNLSLEVTFLQQCMENKVIPNFIRQRITRSKLKCSPTVERTFLSDEIGKCVSTKRFVKVAYIKDLKLTSAWLSELDKLRFLRHLADLDRNVKNKKLIKQHKTISYLKSKRFGKFESSSFSGVKNLSSYKPSETESYVLNHGLKFCIPPRKVTRELIFSEFEILSGQLKHHKPYSKLHIDRLNAKLCDMSHAYCSTPVDLGDFRMQRECYEAYEALRSNPDIIISKADKGSGIVILDRDKYISKMQDILSDNSKFIKLGPVSKLDFTAKIESAFQRRLRKWFQDNYISKEVYDNIRPSGSQRPKLYGLPKTHKPNCPLRPILSMVGSPQHGIAKFLISVLSPVLDKFSQHIVKDSFSFVQSLQTLSSNKNIMCSFDIKSLFTNVPLAEVLQICIDQLYNSDITPPNFPQAVCYDLLKMATTNVEFSFNDVMYRQIDGVAMGSPLGPILANIFVGFQEERLFKIVKKPIAYFRYVDDIFAVFNSQAQMDKFHKQLSKLHNALVFTKEDEDNNSIAFLDVYIERNHGSLVTSVHRKSTFTGDYIPWSSFCPKRQKLNLISCLTHRALKICSASKLDDEKEKILNIFSALGYPEHIVKSVMNRAVESFHKPRTKSDKTPVYLHLPYIGPVSNRFEKQAVNAVQNTFDSVRLRVIFRTRRPLNGIVKDVSPITDNNNVIYQFKCHCDSEYIGRTSQRFHIRRDQHVTAPMRKWMCDFKQRPTGDVTAIGEHLLSNLECAKHYNDRMFKILARGRTPFHLSVLESLFITTLKPVLCKQKQFVYKTNLFKML
jgi:hypothetical protein